MDMLRIFDGNTGKTPDKVYLRYDGRDWSYRQVQDESRRIAQVFRELGVSRGDRVALMCFNTPGFVSAMLASWRLGAVVTPINHKLQPPEVAYILKHSQARVCVADGTLAPVVQAAGSDSRLLTTDSDHPDVDRLERLAEGVDGIDGEDLAEDEIAEILYTSGTTGQPKGCLHTHRNVVLVAMFSALGMSITRDERLLMAVPIWHASPLNNWLMGTTLMGGAVVLLREYQPLEFLQSVQRDRITLCFGPPVIYTTPLHTVPDLSDHDLSSVRAWLYGGGPIGADVARRLSAEYRSQNFYQVYGMTETGPIGTILYPDEQVAKAGSIGRVALPGADMRLVRDDGAAAEPGDVGEIWLRTETVMQGYLGDPDATAAALAEGGWYRSGDLARMDEDGYLFIVDRRKDMIVTGGENVYSKEVEDALSAHPAVKEVAVIGRPHPEWGETVVAHVVLVEGSEVDGPELRGWLSDKLARYKIPREYVFATTLPRTPSGKVQKHLLEDAEVGA
jgi:feruloyl-CoA synthase